MAPHYRASWCSPGWVRPSWHQLRKSAMIELAETGKPINSKQENAVNTRDKDFRPIAGVASMTTTTNRQGAILDLPRAAPSSKLLPVHRPGHREMIQSGEGVRFRPGRRRFRGCLSACQRGGAQRRECTARRDAGGAHQPRTKGAAGNRDHQRGCQYRVDKTAWRPRPERPGHSSGDASRSKNCAR